MTNPVVGVSPPAAFVARPRLFAALGQALDVEFADAQAGHSSVLATVHIEEEPAATDMPSLTLGPGSGTLSDGSSVRFTQSALLDGHLRGWTIADEQIRGIPCLGDDRAATTLAEAADLPVWSTRTDSGRRVDRAVLVPDELGADETLRSRIAPGRFFGLLPLVAFIRSLHDRWHRPAVRASYIMDDPNLHAVKYGYIDFEKVAVDANAIGFHLSVAMIPLDQWFTSKKAANLFKAQPNALSLLMHGNSHTKHELGDNESPVPRLQVLAQGLRRVDRFETRSGIPVAKVMAAPHGRCSEESATAMAQLGYEAICMTRPLPWLKRPPTGMPLVGWFPADTHSIMPTIERFELSSEPEELPLRAFLGHPIVLYGHDSDVGDQPDVFATWAEQVARLDDVSWASVGDISRSLVSWRSDGETMRVRPHARLVNLSAASGIKRIVVEAGGEGYARALVRQGAEGMTTASLADGAAEITVSADAENLQIQTQPDATVDRNDVPSPRRSPWPMTRRLLTEARDRGLPMSRAIRKR